MSNHKKRDFTCSVSQTIWHDAFSVLSGIRSPKSLVQNAIERSNGIASNGFLRIDVLLTGLQLPCTKLTLSTFLDEHDLWAFTRLPDFLHINLNHSKRLQQLLLQRMSSAAIAEANALLRPKTGTTLSLGARTGWTWRRIWMCGDIWDGVCDKYNLVAVKLMLNSYRRILASAYGCIRSSKSLLRLTADCFIHHALFCVFFKQSALIAEHFIWPHAPVFARLMPLRFGLTEASEGLFRPLRRIAQYAAPHGAQAVTDLLQRLLLFLALRRAKRRLRKLSVVPVATEPCQHCVSEHARTRTVALTTVVGSTAALEFMLSGLGFVEGQSWKRTDAGIEVFDAHLDPEPTSPALPSLSQSFHELTQQRKAEVETAFQVQQQAEHVEAMQTDVHVVADEKDEKQTEDKEADERDEDTGLRPDDFLTDEDFAAIFGSEDDQRAEEDDDDAAADRDETDDPTFRSKHSACPQCGSYMHSKHQYRPP